MSLLSLAAFHLDIVNGLASAGASCDEPHTIGQTDLSSFEDLGERWTEKGPTLWKDASSSASEPLFAPQDALLKVLHTVT